jgi:apolipoprotein N-acyltransferase
VLGWLAGTVATLLSTVVPATIASTAYWGVPLWGGVVIALTVGQVFGAGSFALAAVLAGDPGRGHGALVVLRVALAWAGAEYVRSTVLTGLPWLLLGHSLALQPRLIQAAEFGGEPLVSFLLAALNCALFLVLLPGRRRLGAWLGIVVVAVFGLASISMPRVGDPGSVRLLDGAGETWQASARVRLVQGNLSNSLRGDPGGVRPAVERLVDLSRSDHAIDLTVWPENAVNVALPMNQELVALGTADLGRGHLLIGTPRVEGSVHPRLYNSAVLFGPEREIVGMHDKKRLLPFAEYWPWPLDSLDLPGVVTTAGSGPQVLLAGDLRVGAMICYEIVFSEIAHSLARDGAGILVNMSNDAWFGTTGAIEQHFAAAVFRAVETRRPLLRSTNTGITAAIDAAGRVVVRLPPEQANALEVEVRPSSESTWAMRWGGAVGILGLVTAGLATLLDEVTGRQDRGARDPANS